jgi:glutathione S-transferase
MPIRLYRAPFSTNVERVALALAHKGIEVESVVIDYSDRSPVLEVSRQGLVPVVVDEDTVRGQRVVSDSQAILRYLEERDPDPPLFPREPARRAELEVFLEWFDQVWKGPPNAIEEALERGEQPDPRHAERMEAWLDLFESMLEGRDHLFGEFSAADCVAFPFLKYARPLPSPDDDPFHLVLAEHQSTEGRPNLAAWIERVDARPRAY